MAAHMPNWEYKAISSGKGGFASPALFEKFLNDLGQEEWEIIHFHAQPDNPLAFTGLARRSTQRDWTLEDAAAAAARAEADKLRAEFEAKFKAAKGSSQPAEEEQAETFLAEEKLSSDDSYRSPVDTSRDQDPDAPEEEGEKDDWDKLAEEDELPTFFDALKPHMRRNQRGPGMSVGVDYLAKKWKLDESDIRGALVECGFQIPADENARPVYIEYEGDLYWANINRRGELWINVREKPEPKFRIVQGNRVENGSEASEPQQGAGESPGGEAPGEESPPSQEGDREREHGAGDRALQQKTLLAQIRGMMRRNRHGNGWSGSFGYLTKALKLDEAGLLAKLAEAGLPLAADGAEGTVYHEEGDFVYWMQRNARGEIWINSRKGRAPKQQERAEAPADSPITESAGAPEGAEPSVPEPAPETFAAGAEAAPAAAASAVPERGEQREPSAEAGGGNDSGMPGPAPANGDSALAAVRLLLEPKARGEGVAAQVPDVASRLGRSEDELLAALVSAGLNIPEDTQTKPTFGEHGGEIFWLNRNARGELWLNAKPSRARRIRTRRSETSASRGADYRE